MDFQVIWSPNAVRDLDGIATYIANDSAIYAASFVSRVLKVSQQLRKFPQSGRVVPEFADPNLRERIISHYRFIYRLRTNDILLLALIHGRRLMLDNFDPEADDSK
ncbi:MAG: type II toxin-antitoxin system RelE/ParE family toxin [Candidatus Hydrogenedentes bacterium]|nr:type II toxin-antitoxin system RelE/ParE family toxin [Candidatus Hydrogenedentota bacterium]